MESPDSGKIEDEDFANEQEVIIIPQSLQANHEEYRVLQITWVAHITGYVNKLKDGDITNTERVDEVTKTLKSITRRDLFGY